MFFVVNKDKEVVARCREKKEIYKTIFNLMNSRCGAVCTQVIDFSAVDKEGYYYTRQDEDYELRKYEFFDGYFMRSCVYEEVDEYHISYYDGKQSSSLKKSLFEVVNPKKLKITINDNQPTTPVMIPKKQPKTEGEE